MIEKQKWAQAIVIIKSDNKQETFKDMWGSFHFSVHPLLYTISTFSPPGSPYILSSFTASFPLTNQFFFYLPFSFIIIISFMPPPFPNADSKWLT